MPEIILASASPRRHELMQRITEDFRVVVSDVDEEALRADTPKELAGVLAHAKCNAVAQTMPDAVVVGCDTVVECDGVLFEKPRDTADARRMITALASNTHKVHTGVCVVHGTQCVQSVSTTLVTFCTMTEQEIEAYIATPEPYDKAGGYGIQGDMAKFVAKIDGCFYNVMGLPVSELYQMLQKIHVL